MLLSNGMGCCERSDERSSSLECETSLESSVINWGKDSFNEQEVCFGIIKIFPTRTNFGHCPPIFGKFKTSNQIIISTALMSTRDNLLKKVFTESKIIYMIDMLENYTSVFSPKVSLRQKQHLAQANSPSNSTWRARTPVN